MLSNLNVDQLFNYPIVQVPEEDLLERTMLYMDPIIDRPMTEQS